jgi:hypothetical protein
MEENRSRQRLGKKGQENQDVASAGEWLLLGSKKSITAKNVGKTKSTRQDLR